MGIILATIAVLHGLGQQTDPVSRFNLVTYVREAQVIKGGPVSFVLEIKNNTDQKQKICKNIFYSQNLIARKGVELEQAEKLPRKLPDVKDRLLVDVECLVPKPTSTPLPKEDLSFVEIAPGDTAFLKVEIPPGVFPEGECKFRVFLRRGEQEVARSQMQKIQCVAGKKDKGTK